MTTSCAQSFRDATAATHLLLNLTTSRGSVPITASPDNRKQQRRKLLARDKHTCAHGPIHTGYLYGRRGAPTIQSLTNDSDWQSSGQGRSPLTTGQRYVMLFTCWSLTLYLMTHNDGARIGTRTLHSWPTPSDPTM